MSSSLPRLVQGREWLPCGVGIALNLHRAYREDREGTSPDGLTHRQRIFYLFYGAYQLGSLAGAVQGLVSLLQR